MSRGYQKWRRHTCKRCFAVFTTRETADMSISYRFEAQDGSMQAFSRDTLFMSIVGALMHLPGHIPVASDLTATILTNLQDGKRLLITRSDIIESSTTVLRRYNLGASQIYRSQHPL